MVFLVLNPYQGISQLRVSGVPASNTFHLPVETEGIITVPSPDLTYIRQQDEKFPSPYRFGVVLPVDVSPEHSGNWTLLSDGSQVWRATVSAPGALAVSAYFDRFYLPAGGKLFIYDPN